MEQDVPETVFYDPERLTRSGPVGPDLLISDRGYERSNSRNLTGALTFRRHISAISDGKRVPTRKPGNPGHDKAKVWPDDEQQRYRLRRTRTQSGGSRARSRSARGQPVLQR